MKRFPVKRMTFAAVLAIAVGCRAADVQTKLADEPPAPVHTPSDGPPVCPPPAQLTPATKWPSGVTNALGRKIRDAIKTCKWQWDFDALVNGNVRIGWQLVTERRTSWGVWIDGEDVQESLTTTDWAIVKGWYRERQQQEIDRRQEAAAAKAADKIKLK